MSKETIYIVQIREKATGEIMSERLVEANTANLAERHVIGETVVARRATTREVANMMGRDMKVERTGE